MSEFGKLRLQVKIRSLIKYLSTREKEDLLKTLLKECQQELQNETEKGK